MLAAQPPRRRSFLAFQGGGAAGLVHLGALHAIEASGRFDVTGYAGTSAGAMVAALAAAGWRAENLFPLQPPGPDGTRPATILDRLGYHDATDLFGQSEWRGLLRFRNLLDHGGRMLLGTVLGYALAAPVLGVLFGSWALVALGVGIGLDVAAQTWRLLRGGGDLSPVRDAFDAALREHLPNPPADVDRVTFAHLPNLKILASNLTRRRLEVFSAQTRPNVAVADAVCASVCFPFAFRPWPIEDPDRAEREWFLDGGLLSNLPAWPFDEERRLHPDALTLAIAIDDDPQVPTAAEAGSPDLGRSGLAWFGRMIRTAVFGGETLSTRGAGPIEVLRLRTDVPLLAFDLSWDLAQDRIRQARRATDTLLANQVLDVPDRLRAITADIRAVVEDWQNGIAALLDRPPQAGSVRVSFFVPEDHLASGLVRRQNRAAVRSLTSRFGAGFEDWADEGLVLGVDPAAPGSVVAKAWLDEEDSVGFLDTLDGDFLGPENRHRRRVLRPGLAWVLALPIRLPRPSGEERDEVDAILAIDSTMAVRPEPALRAAFQDRLESLISEEIKPRYNTGGMRASWSGS